jgi:Acyltransferase family.
MPLWVIFMHTVFWFRPWLGLSYDLEYKLNYPPIYILQGFLLLSGFLLTRGLLKRGLHESGLNLKQLGRFWFKRLVRLGPTYWLFLAVVAAITLLGYHIMLYPLKAPWPLEKLLPFIPFQGNWAMIPDNSPLVVGHLWFLGIEAVTIVLLP